MSLPPKDYANVLLVEKVEMPCISLWNTSRCLIALGAGLGIWGVINLMEGYGNDNPGANAHVR